MNRDNHWIVNVLEYVTLNSTATRKKVGAIIVKDYNFIVGQGFNSMPRTAENQACEDECGKTRSDVIHAEAKAITNAAMNGYSTKDATLYCTIPPCPVCCGLIIEAGISRVVYKDKYWSETNLSLLTNAGITVEHFKDGY